MDQPTTRTVSAPAHRELTAPPRTRSLDRARVLYLRLERALTLEVLLYTLFVLVAAGTRFWDLGSRPLHHDESLHAYFSWQYYMGRGYEHDPMMHGPLLFHMTALVYLLFGDSEYTARLMPAVFGTISVGLPYLLRRQLGRASMLAASFLLLISPQMWYYGRFARNEAWCIVFTMLVVIGLVRWMDSRRPGWLHLAWVGWVLLYVSKEISFIVLFTFVTVIVLALGLAHARAALAWLFALPVGVLAGMILLPALLDWPRLPAIPFDEPSLAKSLQYTREMLGSRQVLTTMSWGLVWLGVEAALLYRARIPRQLASIREGAVAANPLSTALAWLPRKRLHVALLVGEFLLISVPLYTSLFTNVRGGLLSGSFGQLFYWLAQQEVERGGQPWYYYLILEPTYDPIATLLGTAALVWGAVWLLRWWRRGTEPLTLLQLSFATIAYWAVVSFVIYGWAGEKMPWLGLHMALPMIFLASIWGARALGVEEGWRRSIAARRPGTLFFVGSAAVVAGWVVYRMAGWSLQEAPQGQSPLAYGLLALVVLAVAAGYWLGVRQAARSLSMLGLGLLTVYTLHSAVQLSYRNGAVPVEQAVYVQSTPRVTNVMRAITSISERTAGGQTAHILYDDFVSWPFVWYLRDFPNARFTGEGLKKAPAADVQFVLLGASKESEARPYLRNYTAYRYPMRWWFPEEMYRDLVPEGKLEGKGKLQTVALNLRYALEGVASVRKPEQQARLWRYLAYRRPDGVLNSSDMTLYVRNDLVGAYNAERL